MYIIELITKFYLNKKKKDESTEESKDYEKCEHIFLPLDSSAELFACTKCGFVVPKTKLDKNFFLK